MMKSTVDEIRQRFDADVERFSNLDTGQAATMDARLCMELVAEAAAAATPEAKSILDIGCGAGNYSLMLLDRLGAANPFDVTLIDLSRPMLDAAAARIGAATAGRVQTVQADVRDIPLGEARHDVIVAAAVLHHLREEAEWVAVFEKIHAALRPGGSFWVFDLVDHAHPSVREVLWRRYGVYLEGLGGEGYRQKVFGYIEQEDTPRPLTWQLRLLRRVGFTWTDVLHANGPFAAFGGGVAEEKS